MSTKITNCRCRKRAKRRVNKNKSHDSFIHSRKAG